MYFICFYMLLNVFMGAKCMKFIYKMNGISYKTAPMQFYMKFNGNPKGTICPFTPVSASRSWSCKPGQPKFACSLGILCLPTCVRIAVFPQFFNILLQTNLMYADEAGCTVHVP